MKVPSKLVIDQLNTSHKNFIWNNKRPTIKHSTLIADYCEGGYKDVNIENKIVALKIKWVTKLLDSNFHLWKIIPNLLFSDLGGTRPYFIKICSYRNSAWLKLSNILHSIMN